jgi:hypothetical protein
VNVILEVPSSNVMTGDGAVCRFPVVPTGIVRGWLFPDMLRRVLTDVSVVLIVSITGRSPHSVVLIEAVLKYL